MRRKDREGEGCDSWWQASILQSLPPLSQSFPTSRMRMAVAAMLMTTMKAEGGLGPTLSLSLSVASGDRMHSEKGLQQACVYSWNLFASQGKIYDSGIPQELRV